MSDGMDWSKRYVNNAVCMKDLDSTFGQTQQRINFDERGQSQGSTGMQDAKYKRHPWWYMVECHVRCLKRMRLLVDGTCMIRGRSILCEYSPVQSRAVQTAHAPIRTQDPSPQARVARERRGGVLLFVLALATCHSAWSNRLWAVCRL